MATNEIIVKMVLDRWWSLIKEFDLILSSLTDEQLQKDIVPGKNRGVYLLGHMVAVHDDMLRLLDMGDKAYPELFEPFVKSPDKSVAQLPSIKDLRNYWMVQCEALKGKFEKLNADNWFEKHTAVSSEEFIREPHRNKLNVVLTRTTHLAYHTGQLMLLK